MKLLILGANGQVGYELAQYCDNAVALTREQVDFSTPGLITKAIDQHQPDVVINAVAYTAVDKAETEPSLAMLINAVAVQELARVCKQHDAWCVHYSTDYVFDGTSNQPYKESDLVKPLGIYGMTKFAGEVFLQQESEKYIILRTSWVYSWRGVNFVKTMLRLADEKEELNIVNDQQGCPTYAVDIAQATKKVIESLGNDNNLSGVYHLTGSQHATWYDFAKSIFSQVEKSIKVNPIPSSQFPTLAKRPEYSILDNEKLQKTFGLTVPGYDQSLQHCLDRIALAK